MTQTTADDTIAITNNSASSLYALDSTKADGAVAVSNKVLATADGTKLIPQGGTASLVLDDTYVDKNNQTQPSLLYHIVFSQTDWLTPVKVAGVMQDLIEGTYAPVTILADDAAAMQKAFDLDTSIRVYPASAAAQNYAAALKGDVDASAPADGGSGSAAPKVDAFLKTLPGYQTVTFDMMTAVQAYMDTYPYAWARRQETMVYYLYSVDSQPPMREQGTVTLQKTSSVPDAERGDGGYDLTYQSSDGKKTQLYYLGGQFVDDPTGQFGSIALLPAYTLKSTLTGSADDNIVTTILNGTLFGMKVIGLDQKQDSSDSSGRGFWKTLFEPQSTQEVFNSIMQIGGFLMLMHFAGSTLWSAGSKARTTWADAKAKFKKGWDRLTEGKGPPADDNLTSAGRRVADTESARLERAGKAALEERFEAEASRLKTLAKDGAIDDQMRSAASSLKEVRGALESAPTGTDFADFFKAQNAKLESIGTTVDKIKTAKGREFLDKFGEELDRAETASAEAKAAAEDVAKQYDDLDGEGSAPKFEGEEFEI